MMDIKTFTDRYMAENGIKPVPGLRLPNVTWKTVADSVSTSRSACPPLVSYEDVITDVYYWVQRTGVDDPGMWEEIARKCFWKQYQVTLQTTDMPPNLLDHQYRGWCDPPTWMISACSKYDSTRQQREQDFQQRLSPFEKRLLQEIDHRGLRKRLAAVMGVDNLPDLA